MTVKPVYFCYADLKRLDACEERYRFRDVFGDKPVLVTVTTAVVHASEFDWWWIAEAALNVDEFSKFRRDYFTKFPNDIESGPCWCSECDPLQHKRLFVAQAFVEGFIAQGGMEGRRRRR